MSHLIFVLAGALVAGSGWLLWQGRVPPNRIMGFLAIGPEDEKRGVA